MVLRLGPGEESARTPKQSKVMGLTFWETVYAPGSRVGPHAHRSAFVYLVLQGGLTERCDGRVRTALASTVIYHPPGQVHAKRFSETLTLEEIAAVAGVHPVHLASVFRRHYGCTVGDAVRRLRIDYACRQLARSEVSLAEIALDAGFASQSHFTRTFRRLTGTTPAQYRKIFSPHLD